MKIKILEVEIRHGAYFPDTKAAVDVLLNLKQFRFFSPFGAVVQYFFSPFSCLVTRPH